MTNYITIVICGILILGGWEFNGELPVISGLVLITALSGYLYFKNKLSVVPPGFISYVVFIFILSVYEIAGKTGSFSLHFILLFSGGMLFWLISYNLNKDIGKKYVFILFLTVIFLVLSNLYNLIFNSGKYCYWCLIYPFSVNHNHIGDLIVLALLPGFDNFKLLPPVASNVLRITGGIILLLSRSRSALVSLTLATLYLLRGKLQKGTVVKITGLAALLFIVLSFTKGTLFSRIYYLQALYGFKISPLGVGMGNFSGISEMSANIVKGNNAFSMFVHNIALEVLAGVGIFALPFFVFLFQAIRSVIKNKSIDRYPQALFLALTVSFLLDSTYLSPTLMWLWMFFLGLSQSRN